MEARRAAVPEARLEALAREQAPARDLAAALRLDRLAVIAEAKARTPVLGVLTDDYSAGRLARAYADAGADAISVLCQEASFGGRPEHLAEARAATGLPLLRKDFVVTEHQVLEARAYGADALLLIVAALPGGELPRLLGLTRELGMDALVEVHDAAELALALAAGARVVGVNHRDLRTFAIDLGLSERLRPLAPADVVFVAESGIRDGADARRLRNAGVDAILVGEALMRAADPAAKLAELRDGPG
ncbi:MAG: indole-3-glycerol phosphate synthase TrpC [Candidatus Dormibacteraeota bacterium]|nr:indole-3-glycerol phosphate synthase TrpC [Candidatus Dormibacteraeota bacterium]